MNLRYGRLSQAIIKAQKFPLRDGWFFKFFVSVFHILNFYASVTSLVGRLMLEIEVLA